MRYPKLLGSGVRIFVDNLIDVQQAWLEIGYYYFQTVLKVEIKLRVDNEGVVDRNSLLEGIVFYFLIFYYDYFDKATFNIQSVTALDRN